MVREHQFNTGATRPLIIGMAIIIFMPRSCLELLNWLSTLRANPADTFDFSDDQLPIPMIS